MSAISSNNRRLSRGRWLHESPVNKPPPHSASSAAAGIRLDHIQTFLDKTHGQLTIGEIPPIRRAALAAVGDPFESMPWP
jgi:hypothetical protein